MGVSPRKIGFLTALIALALDQGSKLWMLFSYDLASRGSEPLLPFLDLVLVWNKGISYSLLRADTDLGRYGLLAFTLSVAAFLCVWLWRTPHKLTAVALGFLIGGALGNAYDRFAYGAVADFLHFHTPFSLGPLSNYVFNLADVAILAGVAVLLYESFFVKEVAQPVDGAK